MSTFPIFLVPDRILRAKNAMPIVPLFSAIAPNKPSLPPQPYDTNALITYATIGFAVSVIFVFINLVLGAVTGLLSMAAIAYLAWTMNQSFPKRKREHDDYDRKYPRLVQQYQAAKDSHSAEVAKINSPENIARYQQEQLLLALRQTEPHDGENSTAPKGFSEDKFYAHLNHHFRGRIHRSLTSTNPKFKPPYDLYSPDFVYIDRSLSLYIDIEIDEPYYHNTGQPTHFVGATKDINRNNHFLAKNWLVIRFAEEEIARCPKSCCKAIAQIIAEVIGDDLELRQFSGIDDLPTRKQWTEAEAAQMAADNYRQTYLAGD
jgi:hypothetical protein